MRQIFGLKAAAPLAVAALTIACSGKVDDRGTNDRPANDANSGRRQTMALKGCVEAAPGANQYVLRHVQIAPPAEQRTDAPTTGALTITQGSSVRLKMGDGNDLKSHLGRRVSVTGTITDDGRNTIGTTGNARSPEQPESRTDASRAAADEHHAQKTAKEAGPLGQQSLANGVAPELAVEHVSGTGEECNVAPTTPGGR
jgi:hypothetical protein